MYTLYHMLSFILFIVPIFLIYLLPRLSPNTSSCSYRLCTAGYQKGVGKSTPGWRGGSASQHCCLCIVLPWCAPQEGGARWGELRDAWVCWCLNCDFSSASGLTWSEHGGRSSVSPLSHCWSSSPGGMELAVSHHAGLPHCRDQRKWSLRSQVWTSVLAENLMLRFLYLSLFTDIQSCLS